MKALILAAGLGTRLRPITDTIPKILVPIGGQPLLAYHLKQLSDIGVKDVLINTYWLPEAVRDFCRSYNNDNLRITLTHEPELLGSAGTMLANREFFGDEEILVIYGDVLTDINYPQLVSFHRDRNSLATIVCHRVTNVQEKGMVIMDNDDQIINFVEKPSPEEIVSDYVNGGIYIFNPKIFDQLNRLDQKARPVDYGRDIFPFMIKNGLPILAFKFDGFLLDIGNLTNYEQANKIINQLNFNL
jgi:NDP-sugar pyrophosphorylase family protein